MVVVGRGSSKVYPRGGFPLGPKLTRKGTCWVLGFALAPPTKYTLAEEPISPGKNEPTGTKLQKNNHNEINKLNKLHEKEFKVMWRKTLFS